MAASGTVVVETLLEVRDVSHSFRLPSGSDFRVLEKVSLAVMPGEVVALLGPSGCGKSTLLRILAGLVTPTSGEVFYHGEPVRGLTPGVAIVFQSFALFPWLTVLDNVKVVLEAAGLPEADRQTRAEKAIRTVGLAGFEEAYPRELSGGMKQRLGMARALSIEPEILFMDEPFSHVDALTAEGLRAEVIDLWAPSDQNPSSIVMVSHDIKEVVYMADRIVVLAANPGRVGRIVENRLPRPRDPRSRASLELVDYLHEIITGAELPEIASSAPEIVPLPASTADEIVGLLEHLDSNDGVDDVFRIAASAHQDFGRVISVVKSSEMLGFADTPQQGVVLTRLGRDFVRSGPDDRKRIWREELLKLRLFRDVHDRLVAQPEHMLEAEMVHAMITAALPHEHYETIFGTLVRWAQFGNLFAYDDASERLSLQ